MKNLRLVVIQTTAFEDENLTLITDLTDEQLEQVIQPIVERERNGGDEYDNDELVVALNDMFGETNYIQYAIADDLLI